MDDQQRNEREIAEKLSQLPLPDMESSWKQMKALLDEEMPRRGGWFRRNRFWGLGMLALLLFLSVWYIADSGNSAPVLTKKAVNNTSRNPYQVEEEKDVSADPDSLASANKNASDEKKLPDKESPPTDYRIVAKTPTAGQKINRETNDKILLDEKSSTSKTSKPSFSQSRGIKRNVQSKSDADNAGDSDNFLANQTAANKRVRTSDNKLTGYRAPANKTRSGKGSANPAENDTDLHPDYSSTGVNRSVSKGAGLKGTAAGDSLANIDRLDYAKLNLQLQSDNNKFDIGPDSIAGDFAGSVKQNPRMRLKNGKLVKYKKPYSSVGRSFALGFSLPLGFPLGDQKPLAYNFNAGNNTVSDFLPSPHLQYHFNDKAYLQSEIQVMTPQFIRPVLLSYSKTQNTNATITTYNSIYARKLYYFSVPVSMHYSPFKHFYLGTGLQFSSLLSGVALYEVQRTGMVPSGEMYSANYGKFRNDTLSNKLNGSEFRLMMDANYYWNRFTVGLRYNQALSNYVDLRATANSPAVADKNKLLQFYLRYNLWETRKIFKPNLAKK